MVPFVLKCNTVYQEIQQRAKANSTACESQFNSVRKPIQQRVSSNSIACVTRCHALRQATQYYVRKKTFIIPITTAQIQPAIPPFR